MLIRYGHLEHKFVAQVMEATPQELEWLKHFVTFQTTIWVGGQPKVVNTCYLRGSTFPLGLLPSIERFAPKDNITVDVIDHRNFSVIPPQRNVDHSWLRPYQAEVVDKCFDATYGIVSSPVGSGKSKMITAFCERFGGNILVGVHSPDLVRDLGNTFQHHTGERAGWLITDDRKQFMYAPQRVTFCAFPSIYNKLKDDRVRKYLASVDALVVDECHRVAANTISATTMMCSNTLYRLGFSGTPLDRSDGKSIAVMANLGPCRVRIPNSFLIEQGYVAKAVVRMVACQHPTKNFRNYQGAYKAMVVNSATRTKLSADIMVAMEKPGFVFVKERKHGMTLATQAKMRGIHAVYVDGNASIPERQQILNSLRSGHIDVVVSTSIFTTGVDVPQLRSVFNASGGKSAIEAIQKMGRGVRKTHANDNEFELWDIFDKGKWVEDHAKERRGLYLREDADVYMLSSVDAEPIQFGA